MPDININNHKLFSLFIVSSLSLITNKVDIASSLSSSLTLWTLTLALMLAEQRMPSRIPPIKEAQFTEDPPFPVDVNLFVNGDLSMILYSSSSSIDCSSPSAYLPNNNFQT